MSFDNLFLVNGVVVNENLRGQPHDLYIEDAIQETTILTGGISAEYGRFTGGVVSTLTKSGGNEFTGSLRDSLTNPRLDREDRTSSARPIRIDDDQQTSTKAPSAAASSATASGSSRAGRSEDRATGAQTSAHQHPVRRRHTTTSATKAKLTGQITQRHTLVGTYIDSDNAARQHRQLRPRGRSAQPRVARRSPKSLFGAHYNGVFTERLPARRPVQPDGRRPSPTAPRPATSSTARCCVDGNIGIRIWSPDVLRLALRRRRSATTRAGWPRRSYFLSTARDSAITPSSAASKNSTSSATRTTTSREATSASTAISSSSGRQDADLLRHRSRQRRDRVGSGARAVADLRFRAFTPSSSTTSGISTSTGASTSASATTRPTARTRRATRPSTTTRSARASAATLRPSGRRHAPLQRDVRPVRLEGRPGSGRQHRHGGPLRVLLLRLQRPGHQPAGHADQPARPDPGGDPAGLRLVRGSRRHEQSRPAQRRQHPRRHHALRRVAPLAEHGRVHDRLRAAVRRAAATCAPTSSTATGATSTSSAASSRPARPSSRTATHVDQGVIENSGDGSGAASTRASSSRASTAPRRALDVRRQLHVVEAARQRRR